MEFRQIEAFVNAVKYKSFSKAADVTFISQPTISTHIGNLESELGALLLNRGTKEITLTSQGQVFYPYALSLLNERQKAVTSVKNLGTQISGVLDIQTSTIPGQYYLPGLLRAFSDARPSVRYYVEQSDSHNVLENIKNQRGEVGFTGYRANDRLCYVPVFTDEFVLLAPDEPRFSGYENGECLSLQDFKDEAFILREDGSGTRKEMEKSEGSAILKNISVIARMNSMEAICRSVECGLGLSIVSRMAVSGEPGKGKLRYFSLRELGERRSFYMVYNKGICLSPLAEQFCKFVIEKNNTDL